MARMKHYFGMVFSFRRYGLLRMGASLLWLGSLSVSAQDSDALIGRWLSAQTNIQTWTAAFTQTRSLKSFTQPLVSTGQVWFATPNRFRWELMHPGHTIAVRAADQMLVIYPKLKRVEKYPLTGTQMGQWKETLSLLEAGFPGSRQEMESRFKIASATVADNVCETTLVPKSATARRMMPQIKIAFSTTNFLLRATELQFADGSTMRNEFAEGKLNIPVEPEMFAPALDNTYKVVEPLKPK